MKIISHALAALCITGLTACGGGGGGSGGAGTNPPAVTTSFPLQAAWKTLTANGFSGKSGTVSGSCGGTAFVSQTPANQSTTFEGAAALRGLTTLNASMTGCSLATVASVTEHYYNANYVPLGTASSSSYGVYTTQNVYPATVKVGDTGTLGAATSYTNSSKSVISSTMQESYVIEADGTSSSTAIVNITSKYFGTGGQSLGSEQGRYRIDAAGTLTLVSIELQYTSGSVTRLLFSF